MSLNSVGERVTNYMDFNRKLKPLRAANLPTASSSCPSSSIPNSFCLANLYSNLSSSFSWLIGRNSDSSIPQWITSQFHWFDNEYLVQKSFFVASEFATQILLAFAAAVSNFE